MLKTKLFSLLGITSIIATSVVTTSCSCSYSHFNLSGGSLSLNATSGDAGQDKAAWKLIANNREIEDEDIRWELIPATTAKLPNSISIINGLVFWTDQITAGTYEFFVCASYKKTKIRTEKIALSLCSDSSLVLKYDWEDSEECLFYYDKSASKESKTPKNWYLFDEAKETIIPSFECEFYVNSFGYSSVFRIDKFGFLTWNEQIVIKNFNFQIICWYDNIRIVSKICTLIVFDYLNSFHFILNDDKCSYTIYSYDKFDYGVYDSLYIPSVYNNLPVSIIGDGFLSGCDGFDPIELQIPETVHSIGNNFLSGCSSFNPKEFQIPKTVGFIGDGFLSSCTAFKLTKFQIPRSVHSIGNNFLSGCTSFNPTEFNIPETVSSIGDGFLSGCTAFNFINFQIPKNVYSIGDGFLSGCSKFNPAKFQIPKSVHSIGDNFLSGCATFNPTELFRIPETVSSIGAGLLHNCYSINCLKIACSYVVLNASETSFSVDDITSKVYTNGLIIYLWSEQELDGFTSNFGNISDSENKIFRNLIVVC